MKHDVFGFVVHAGGNDVLPEEIDRHEYERVKNLRVDSFVLYGVR